VVAALDFEPETAQDEDSDDSDEFARSDTP